MAAIFAMTESAGNGSGEVYMDNPYDAIAKRTERSATAELGKALAVQINVFVFLRSRCLVL